MSDVLVLGAGVVGMATAYALARDGHSITVIDQGSTVATSGASFGNGAQLSYCYTDAFASPATARKLPKFMFGLDDAFRWKPSPDLEFWTWITAFLANTRLSAFERNTLDVMALAFQSREALAALMAAEKLDFDHQNTGKLHILPTSESVQAMRSMMERKNALGASQSLLTADEAIEREPALAAYGSPFAGALWSPLDELGDPVKFCRGLRTILEDTYGVSFLLDVNVKGLRSEGQKLKAVETSGGDIPCRSAVLALGVASRRIARTAGLRLSIWPLQGYSLTVAATNRAPLASITDTSRKMVFCRIGDRLRVAGLADLGDGPFRQDRFETLVAGARTAFPEAGDYSASLGAWTGYRPMTPTSQPIIGSTKVSGLYLNCGHGSLGWTLAMGSAERLASMMKPADVRAADVVALGRHALRRSYAG